MSKYSLEIYTRPTCGDCQDLKRYLEENKLTYKANDVEKDSNKEKELIELIGNRIVPALVFSRKGLLKRKKIFIGFSINREEIEELIKKL